MDLSALIFVAVAVAWAVYLVPKAIRHHDEVASTRSVDRFSEKLRVLARREAVSARDSRLVLTPGRSATPTAPRTPVVPEASHSGGTAEPGAHPATSSAPRRPEPARGVQAARRRRRVLGLLLGALVVVIVLAATAVLGWVWVAAPAALLVAWLLACRLMVRRETRRAGRSQAARPARGLDRDDALLTRGPAAPAAHWAAGDDASTGEVMVVGADAHDGAHDGSQRPVEPPIETPTDQPGMWDPVPVTLPTYVDKAPAARTVRTIDLDSTGVWSSGPSAADSVLAREAEDAERSERAAQARAESEAAEAERRATGS